MPKVPKTPALRWGIVVLVVVVLGASAVIGVRSHRASPGSSARSAPVAVTTTVPYTPRSGPDGTVILTETVDPLTLAVPIGWKAPAANALTLPVEMAAAASSAPRLAALIQAQSSVAAIAGVRLFAYQPVAPAAFVAVVSYSSPGTPPLTFPVTGRVGVDRRVPGFTVTIEQLPVGEVLKYDSVPGRSPRVPVEYLIFVSSGRTVTIEMASDASGAGIPPLFAQIGQSLRQN